MNILLLLAYGILNTLFVLLVSPLFISLIKKVKAYAQGRKGPSLLQTYRNLAQVAQEGNCLLQEFLMDYAGNPNHQHRCVVGGEPLCAHDLPARTNQPSRQHHPLPVPVGACQVLHGLSGAGCR